MNKELLEKAKQRMPCVPLLINVVSRRVRQLQAGLRPYVVPKDRNETNVDIVLREIVEGKLTVEIGFGPAAAAEPAKAE